MGRFSVSDHLTALVVFAAARSMRDEEDKGMSKPANNERHPPTPIREDNDEKKRQRFSSRGSADLPRSSPREMYALARAQRQRLFIVFHVAFLPS